MTRKVSGDNLGSKRFNVLHRDGTAQNKTVHKAFLHALHL